MQIAIVLLTSSVVLAQTTTGGQTPARPAARARPTMTVQVTDLEGQPIAGVWVKASGPVDRETATDDKGAVTFRNMLAGTYRLRFEHDTFVTLERETTMQARSVTLTVALNAAPPPPPAPVREVPAEPPALPPAGPPTSLSLIDLIERNFVGNAPSLTSPVGCAPGATSSVLQLRDPLPEHVHSDADEMLYVIAGEGTHSVAGKNIHLEAGVFAVVPRGTAHSITRRGSRPVIFLSVLSGQPCQR
jgi:mannose-6-phosphate isomerase-like protein (cupin superfamily)